MLGIHQVVEVDDSSIVSVANSISITNFYFLNPEIDANCTNLELGEAYCIAAVGDISIYSGYPTTTPLFTVTTASFLQCRYIHFHCHQQSRIYLCTEIFPDSAHRAPGQAANYIEIMIIARYMPTLAN